MGSWRLNINRASDIGKLLFMRPRIFSAGSATVRLPVSLKIAAVDFAFCGGSSRHQLRRRHLEFRRGLFDGFVRLATLN
jgi:hypothetical protein